MDDQAFQLLMSEIKDLKAKVDLLLAKEHTRQGAMAVMSVVISFIVTLLFNYLKH